MDQEHEQELRRLLAKVAQGAPGPGGWTAADETVAFVDTLIHAYIEQIDGLRAWREATA